jgi:cyclophilin family peptidyl-prolyl cis-trans isomerase
MMKTLTIFLLMAPLAACGDSNNPVATTGRTAATATGSATAQVNSNDPNQAKLADMPPVDFQGETQQGSTRQEPKAPRLNPQATASGRTAKYHFEDASKISDEQLGEYYVEMDMTIDGEDIGTITVVLWPDKAPITVRNFLRYADEGFYDGKIFHRILREFMIQGGSSTNTAAGQGPHGMIKGEFSSDPKYNHEYGVLSMARSDPPDSGSSQFFIITERSMSARGLDGKYASFGKMVHGVETLEKIANIETRPNPASQEPSMPTKRAAIKEARVIKGTPTKSEVIERPKPDLKGEPERIRIQHVLISFDGKTPTAKRTQAEAEALAKEILERAQAGEDFDALVQEYSDDPGSKDTTPKGSYSMLNTGIKDYEAEEKSYAMQMKAQDLQADLLAQVEAKAITMDEARSQYQATIEELMKELPKVQWFPRAQMMPGFGNVGFKLQVGEIGIANFDPKDSAYGWHIIKRYE